VVRRVGCPGRKVDEERFVRGQGLHGSHPLDGLIRHVGHEVVVRVLRQLDLDHAIVDGRRPLVGLAAHEAVELVEAAAGRPAVGGSGRADLPHRRLMVLAEVRRRVAVVAQHHRQRRHLVGALGGVAGVGRRRFRDRAHVVHVVVAAAEQRHPCRRAEGGRVELVVPKPAVGQAVHCGHGDGTSEGTGVAESHVIDQHDEDVGRSSRRLDLEPRRRWRGIPDIEHGAVRVLGFVDRQRGAIRFRLCQGRCRAHQA